MRLLMKLTLILGILVLSASFSLAHPGEMIQKKDLGSGFNKGALDCTAAIVINCDDVLGGTNVGAPANVDYYSCQGWNALAGEVVYVFTPDDDYDVTISLENLDSGNDLALFVLDGCEEDACLGSSDGYGDEEITIALAANAEYYIVVDGYDVDDVGSYNLSILCETTPDPPVELQGADTCQDAVCLDPAFQRAITGTTVGYAADYSPTNGCTGYSNGALGADVVYEVQLENDNTLTVDCERPGYWDHVLYLVTDCNDMDSCVAGSDAGAVNHIEYTHTGPPAFYYLIVDGYGETSEGAYTLTYTHYGVECSTVATEERTWDGVKSLYR